MTSESMLDRDLNKLVRAHGIGPVIAALARWCHANGMNTLFRRLNKLYEHLSNKQEA